MKSKVIKKKRIIEIIVPDCVSIERAIDYAYNFSLKNNVDVWFEYNKIWLRISSDGNKMQYLKTYNDFVLRIEEKEKQSKILKVFFIIVIIAIIIIMLLS